MELFSNREIATSIWFLIIITFIIFKVNKTIIINYIKAILSPKLSCLALIVFIFITLSTIILVKTNIWQLEYLKDTIMYYLFLAIPFTYFKVINNKEPITKRFIKTSLSLSAIFSLFLNLESFSIATEIILLPIISLFSITQTTAKEETVKKIALNILGLIVISILTINISNIFSDPHKYLNMQTLVSFTLPIYYSIILIPCMHLFYIYATYESLFISIDTLLPKDLRLTAKINLIKLCLLSKRTLIKFNERLFMELYNTISKEELIKTLKEIKNSSP